MHVFNEILMKVAQILGSYKWQLMRQYLRINSVSDNK